MVKIKTTTDTYRQTQILVQGQAQTLRPIGHADTRQLHSHMGGRRKGKGRGGGYSGSYQLLGFPKRVRESNGRAEGEKRVGRERKTTQINVVITCHAHIRNSWQGSGKGQKESSVLRAAAAKAGDAVHSYNL